MLALYYSYFQKCWLKILPPVCLALNTEGSWEVCVCLGVCVCVWGGGGGPSANFSGGSGGGGGGVNSN